jgi:hypothetical protein
MRAFGFIGVLATLLIALVAGVIGYNLGLGANVASVATTGGATVVYPGWGFGFGFPFFGFIFAILFFVLIFGLIRRAAWGGHRGSGFGPGGYGPGGWGHRGGWDGRSMPPMADEMLERWHRQKHGEPDTTDPIRSSSPSS